MSKSDVITKEEVIKFNTIDSISEKDNIRNKIHDRFLDILEMYYNLENKSNRCRVERI